MAEQKTGDSVEGEIGVEDLNVIELAGRTLTDDTWKVVTDYNADAGNQGRKVHMSNPRPTETELMLSFSGDFSDDEKRRVRQKIEDNLRQAFTQ
jgi:hypothetical protein